MTKINIKWYPAIFAILHFLINLAFNLFNYFKNGVFNNSMLLGTGLGSFIILALNLVYIYLKKEKTPKIDERIKLNIIKFIAYASQIFFIALVILLTGASYLGLDAIPLPYLWILAIFNMLLVGLGTLIIKFK
ncbi:MAG: hypothetical protein GX079_02220 [Tissierellia bacterium]|nr:hypothetical protein [Tissierellia bacterium]